MLTESGAWKLSGLGLAVRAQFAGANEAATLTFDYSNPSPPSSLQLTQVTFFQSLIFYPLFYFPISMFFLLSVCSTSRPKYTLVLSE